MRGSEATRRGVLGALLASVATAGTAQFTSRIGRGAGYRAGFQFVGAAGLGDVIALSTIGTDLIDAGRNVPVDGFVAAVTFKGMPTQSSAPGVAGFNASKVRLTVTDPGFTTSGAPTMRVRTVTGALPLRRPYPVQIAAGAIPADSWGSNGVNVYYTAAGGTQGMTLPTHTSGTAAAGGVSWQWVHGGSTIGMDPGYFQSISATDAVQYAVLDGPIYAGSTIAAASTLASAYVAMSATSNATASVPTTNRSTLAYEPPVVGVLTLPHLRSTGSLAFEVVADHAWAQSGQQVACVKMRAWNAARTVSTPDVVVSSPSISTIVTPASPGGCAVEVYRGTIDTTGLPTGDCFVEFEVYPFVGDRVFSSRLDGDGADWMASQSYAFGQVVRNGANFYYATTGGVSASSGGPTGTGTGIADGAAIWSYYGNDATKSMSRNVQARHHFYNDPSSLYKRGFAFVDPNGSATGVAGVFASFAEANTAKGAVANCYATIALATAALITYHNTAGGGLTAHNDVGGGEVYLTAGTHSAGYGAASMGLMIAGATWLRIYGDPAAAAGSVVLVPGAGINKQLPRRTRFGRNMTYSTTVTGASNTVIDSSSDGSSSPLQPLYEIVAEGFDFTLFDNSASPVARTGLTWYLNGVFRNAFTAGVENTRAHVAFAAGCLFTTENLTSSRLNISIMNLYGNKVYGARAIGDPRTTGQPAPIATKLNDNVFQSPLGANGACMVSILSGAFALPRLGTSVIGNVIATAAADADAAGSDKCCQIAADGSTGDVRNVLIMHNTMPGSRSNFAYDDLAAGTALRTQWWVRNNVMQRHNNIYDGYDHTYGRNGIRAKNWWFNHGVGHHSNVSFFGAQQGATMGPYAATYYFGQNGKFGLNPTAAGEFVNDASGTGSKTRDGDYHPAASSSFRSMVVIASRKYALDGATRLGAGGAIGAYERT